MTTMTVLWQKLDSAGHDACRVDETSDGSRVRGTAVFMHEAVPARLTYEVECGIDWRTRTASVEGWVGERMLQVAIRRTGAGTWKLNGVAIAGLGDAVDVDFGFTPATNFNQIRRLALRDGECAECPVAWFDFDSGTLSLL